MTPSQKQGAGRPLHILHILQLRRDYSPAPIIRMGVVGVAEPDSFSTVMAKALASAPEGSGGLTTVALPCASGLNTPAGMGAPCDGISQNSYAFRGGRTGMLLATKTRLLRLRR